MFLNHRVEACLPGHGKLAPEYTRALIRHEAQDVPEKNSIHSEKIEKRVQLLLLNNNIPQIL